MSFGNFSQQDNFSQQEMMSEINVTPLVDVMLVLLVVFIITAPLLTPQSLKITLPKTVAVSASTQPHAAKLVVNAQGQIELDNQPLNDTQLSKSLKLRASEPQFQIQIEADKTVPYGRVAELLAIAQRAGVSKLSFITVLGK